METITTLAQLQAVLAEAQQAANKAAQDYLKSYGDGGTCGFAWVIIEKYQDKPIRANSKIGKLLNQSGIEKDYQRLFKWWNPSKSLFQNIDHKEDGAIAAAKVLNKYGFYAYMGSNVD